MPELLKVVVLDSFEYQVKTGKIILLLLYYYYYYIIITFLFQPPTLMIV